MTRTDEADWTEREEQNELETDSRLASAAARLEELLRREAPLDRKSTRLNSSHL